MWNIIFFELSRKDKPVQEFIESLEKKTIAKVIHNIDLLERFGSELKMPHVKKLNREIYELRIRGGEEIRLLFCYRAKDIVLLHGFKKKSQKTPRKELDTALSRLKSL